MVLDQDDIVQSTLHGTLTNDPPSRVVKIFVSSTKSDFEHERRQLHEVVFPELQRYCSGFGIDLELEDIQQGSDIDSILEPASFAQQMREIEVCHRDSLGCFFLCLVGNKYRPYPLPLSIESSEFNHIYNAAFEAGLDVALLDQWYKCNANLVPPAYIIEPPQTKYEHFGLRRPAHCKKKLFLQQVQSWTEDAENLMRIIQYGARVAFEEGLINQVNRQKQKRYFMSGVHAHLDEALQLSKAASQRMLCVIRQFEGLNTSDTNAAFYADIVSQEGATYEEESISGIQELIDGIILSLERRNVHYFSIPWLVCGVDPDNSEHGNYLDKFGEVVLSTLKEIIKDATVSSPEWEGLPSTVKKAVQEVVLESRAHLVNAYHNLHALGVSQSLSSDCGPLLHIQQLMLEDENRMRHSPVIVCGRNGSGKSTLLSQVLMYCTEWLGNDIVRIVRHVGKSLTSTYTPELLRNLCLHISLVFGFDITPKHYSFELGKLSIWFQDLLKLVETTTSDLVIVLDNLHDLRSPPNNQAAILGWLPWNLPANVHIICSVAEEHETVLGLLKSRISTGDNFIQILPLNHTAAVSMVQSNLKDNKHLLTTNQWHTLKERLNEQSFSPLYVKLLSHEARRWTSWQEILDNDVPQTLQELINRLLTRLETKYETSTVRKIASYLTCTHYGLRESEILELLTADEFEGPSTMSGDANTGEFSFMDWIGIKQELGSLLKEYYVGNRPYIHWSNSVVTDILRERFLSNPIDARICHSDLASAFYLSFLEKAEEKVPKLLEITKGKKTDTSSDLLREIDELWFHLLLSKDYKKLKQDAICNFEFLLSAVRGASIGYLRSILEFVKSQFLDWEIELLYNMAKSSVDVLSQDPQQLATEILNWLRPYKDGTSEFLDSLVSSSLRWCNSNSCPVLIPQNSWLNLALAPQVTVITCPGPISHMVSTPDSQYVLCSTQEKIIHMYNLPSKNLIKTFVGHKAAITCLHITPSGRYLVSGSEDTDVILWDVEQGSVKHRLSYHIAGVLCVATTNSETFVLSGSEVGVVIVARLDSGHVVQKLENHRGVINCVAVNSGDDIFVTGSSDCTVCIWCLEDFTLLNTITLTTSICKMELSRDSTFLLLGCEDNTVHVRSLTTGSDVHCLQGHSGTVTSLCFARDNCRCIVGCHNGKSYVFDVLSAKLLQTLGGHSDAVTSLQTQENDTFLISSGGNKIVVWNFYSKRSEGYHPRAKMRKADNHRDVATCVAVSRDGSLAASGSKDRSVKVWHLSAKETHMTLQGHTAPVTCLAFAPNGLFVVSGSEDMTLRVWGLTLGLVVSTFKEHQNKIVCVSVTSDSRRVLSTDVQGSFRLWQADSGNQVLGYLRSLHQMSLHASTVFAIGGKNDNSVRFWPLLDVDSEKSVTHSDAILCYTVTYDCKTVVTGSQDMSLKVWEVATGKLTQVLVGHEGPVTCVAVAPFSPSLVLSGSMDHNLIVWDMTTGDDNFTLRGHKEAIKTVQLTIEGSVVISGSDDNTFQIWCTQTGHRIAMLDLHMTIVSVATSLHVGHIIIQLANSNLVPVIRVHNNPGKGIKLDLPPGTPVNDEGKLLGYSLRSALPKRILLRGNLKREQSFDSFYWDLRSPKHDIGASLEDFKRIPSPFGSRETLHLAGTVWDGSVGNRPLGRSINLPDGGGTQPKSKLSKHKMLKKQHSMFACFPEFTQQPQSPLLSPQHPKMDGKGDYLVRSPVTRLAKDFPDLSYAGNLEENGTTLEETESNDATLVRDSSVCSIS
ncbi:NACHT domain- and WD repeat-containing protein 1-like [Tachypleus tridentatus]|uniref:NACHT domain- and WD repeat-containing protein 1-like n=1 Tax=Tachypleus tridentatus TaxID=6853 RepID=UPI003FD389D5